MPGMFSVGKNLYRSQEVGGLKVVVVGASGLVGWELNNQLLVGGVDVTGTYSTRHRSGLIQCGYENILDSLVRSADYVVLCGAVTDINKCTIEPEYTENINVTKTIELILKCKNYGVVPIYISSDYVFNGSTGNYSETSQLSPITVYGKQKATVEEFIKNNLDQYFVFRLGRTYSVSLNERSLFAEIYKLLAFSKKVMAARDQYFNFTNVEYVAQIMCRFILTGNTSYGLYNLAKQNSLSRYQLALNMASLFSFDKALIQPIQLNDLSLPERRPLNTTLDCSKIDSYLNSYGVV
jgi:dTDP-4-dehydrorhamnose reductase